MHDASPAAISRAHPCTTPTCRQLIQEQLPIRKDQLYNTYGPKGAIPLIPGEWRPQGQELDRLLCAWPSQRRVEGAARTECMHSPQIMCVLRLLSSSATVAFPCPQTPSPPAPRCAWAACSRAAAHLWRWANTAQGLPAAAGCTLSVGSSPVSSPLAASLLMALPAPFHTQSSPSHPQVVNPNAFAVDISGYALGSAVQFTFRPGVCTYVCIQRSSWFASSPGTVPACSLPYLSGCS